MNAPSSSSRRIPYSRRIAAPASSAQHAPPIVVLAHDARPAANEDTATAATERSVNPLWMITAALALFFGTLAVFVFS
jgi:hypothetical protein